MHLDHTPTPATLKPIACLAAALGCLMLSALLGAPPGGLTEPAGASASLRLSPLPMQCEITAHGSGGTALVLTNTTGRALALGEQIAWTTQGTPRPSGEVRRLPRPLAAGEHLSVDSPLETHASGCLARALVETDPPGDPASLAMHHP